MVNVEDKFELAKLLREAIEEMTKVLYIKIALLITL